MKRNLTSIIYKTVALTLVATLVSSCNAFLDEMPDSRTELDTADKITQVLVSAYSSSLPVTIQELMTDNVTDYGSNIDVYYSTFDQAYRFIDVTGESTDSPAEVWESAYAAIAAANHALQAIEELGGGEEYDPQKGEALLCRAYGHFILVNVFCQAYNAMTSNTDLGIPYITEPETTVNAEYSRGTVADVYRQIAADIEEGYPLIDNSIYTQPKYHFNSSAAAAFAAQFYLYYGDYTKSIEYATDAIGDDPSTLYRDWTLFTGTSVDEYANAFVSSDEAANFMLHSTNSIFMRFLYGRYIVTYQKMLNEVFTETPWGYFSNSTHKYYTIYYAYNRSYFCPKFTEYFVYTNIVAGIGYPYNVFAVFTAEKTMIDRAEAYALSGNSSAALRDLNHFYKSLGFTRELTTTNTINSYYSSNGTAATNSLDLNPQGLSLTNTQIGLVRACLHARRIMTLHEGTRIQDLKRYGVPFTHELDGEANVEIEPYDLRLAVQIPNSVVSAGIEANPR